ncbi:MAG TPA: alpha-L-fucosidase [Phycisphaerae bacterium]|nr:alpha-L-fucosidase [Phycisphaerae bacterium]
MAALKFARLTLWSAAAAAAVIAFVLLAPALRAADEDAKTEQKAHKTDWLYKAKWGVMFHFAPHMLQYADPTRDLSKAEEWNKVVAEFDADGLAKQIKEIGAGYLLIAARHGGAMPIAPNSAIDKAAPGTCPKRDLIADLADALEKQGLHLMLYYSTGMGIDKPKQAQQSAAVIEEWSRRYGKKVKGWWLDNNVGDEELQKLLADACRAGNGDSLVAFSPPRNPRRNSKYEDFTAGNCHGPRMIGCNGRFLDGAQWHMLSYLGFNWGGYSKKGPGPRYSPETAVSMTMRFLPKGGVVTWDVKPTLKGLIAEEFIPTLTAIGEAAATVAR